MPVFDQNDAFYVPFQHISSMRRPGPRIRIWMLKPRQYPWIPPKFSITIPPSQPWKWQTDQETG